jgi:hypothetical protein
MPEFKTPEYFFPPPNIAHTIGMMRWGKKNTLTHTGEYPGLHIYKSDDVDAILIEKIKEILAPSISKFEQMTKNQRMDLWLDETDRIEDEQEQKRKEEKHWKWTNPHI